MDAFDRKNPEILAQCLKLQQIERLRAERAQARRAVTRGEGEDDAHPERGGDALRRTPMDEDRRQGERRGRRGLKDSAGRDSGSTNPQPSKGTGDRRGPPPIMERSVKARPSEPFSASQLRGCT